MAGAVQSLQGTILGTQTIERPLNKGCNKQLRNCFRWPQLTVAVEKKLAGVHKNSTTLLAVCYGRDCCLLFSIPAKDVASYRQSSQVYIAYSNEKRTITRSPITDSDSNIYLFQLLWKGTTDLCSGTCWTRHFANFRSGFISHSSLKIIWEISHKFAPPNIPRRNIPTTKPRPPPPPCMALSPSRLVCP